MKILNAYAGLGGNRLKWKGHSVTAVEWDPKIAKVYSDQFPNDEIIIGDAHQFILDHFREFDFIWTSPPCQSHSKMNKATRHPKKRYPDLSLYEEIIFLRHFFKGGYVVENVQPYYEPLIKPTAIVGRHYFWSSFFISPFLTNKRNIKSFITRSTIKEAEILKKWLGISYDGALYYNGNANPCQVLLNCVHPDIGEAVLKQYKSNTILL